MTTRAISPPAAYNFPPGLSRNLPTYLFSRFFKPGNPILLFEHLKRTYGNIAHYKLGGSRIVFINEPELIREVLITQAFSFIKERTQRRMKILLGEGLITSEGDFHMRERKIAAPAFHRQRIESYATSMVNSAAALCDRWRRALHDPVRSNAVRASRIDIGAAMMDLSLEIVARTLFDTEVTDDVRAINDEVNAIMGIYNFLVALPHAEAYLHLPIPGLMRFRRARAHLDSIVYRMISARRAQGTDRGDLLSMLLASRYEGSTGANDNGSEGVPAPASQGAPGVVCQSMTDEQVRDEVITIFLAGYETVANALTWTWYLLSQNPDAEARLHAEIDAVLRGRTPAFADLRQLPYTEMVLSESMRLYPPAWAMGRQSTRDLQIGGYHLPAGTYFFFSQYILQRSPEYFPDPLRFNPERFTPEAKAARPRFAYFPFGGGSRQCIGESFAWMEGILVLATIAQQFRFELEPNQTIAVQPKITLRPKYPIHMRIMPRG